MDNHSGGMSLASSPPRRVEEPVPDPRTSLSHVLAVEPLQRLHERQERSKAAVDSNSIDKPNANATANGNANLNATVSVNGDQDKNEDALESPKYTSTTTTTRRNANGTLSSVFSGNKMKHLKKEDGEPLWRKDIQYDFLRFVFENEHRVFHKFSDGTYGHTFADIYIDAMANSSKCSNILKEKLLQDREAAKCIAMVCLLVNVGRMNTTLNFFPEMRAQLRTYHSIPSLQANQDASAHKQLQDAPRLKSILKGATEDTPQPNNIDDLKAAPVPRSTPVNLIFVLSQYAPRVSETHFTSPRDFFDLVTRSSLSSESRANAFLWLIWWYAESDFSREASLWNPFGPGVESDTSDGVPLLVPSFEHLSEEQANMENVDTEDEISFGMERREERKMLLNTEGPPSGPGRGRYKRNYNALVAASEDGTTSPGHDRMSPISHITAPTHSNKRPKPAPRNLMAEEEHAYHSDRTRSASPPAAPISNAPTLSTPGMRINTLLNEATPTSAPTPALRPAPSTSNKGVGRGNWPRNKKKDVDGTSQIPFKAPKPDQHHPKNEPTETPSPAAAASHPGTATHGYLIPVNGNETAAQHRTRRTMTQHQLALEKFRRQQVEYLVDRRLKQEYARHRRGRQREGTLLRCWRRLKKLPSGYDTDEDEGGRPAGFFPVVGEEEDWGEEMYDFARVLKRARRRLAMWDGDSNGVGGDGKGWAQGEEGMDGARAGEGPSVDDKGKWYKMEQLDENDDDNVLVDDVDRRILGELDDEGTESEMQDEVPFRYR